MNYRRWLELCHIFTTLQLNGDISVNLHDYAQNQLQYIKDACEDADEREAKETEESPT